MSPHRLKNGRRWNRPPALRSGKNASIYKKHAQREASLLALLSINNISKYFGDQLVLSGVSLQLHQGEKAGLVGPNGAGKTTLLKIVTGEEEADEGEVYLAKGLSLGYLRQKPEILPRATLKEHLMEALKDMVFLRQELASLEQQMASPAMKENSTALASLMEKYGATHLFVGEVEQEMYTINLPLEDLVNVFSSDGVDVYQIR